MGRGGRQVVSVLAFYSDDPSSNPAEVYNFPVKLLLKRTKINKKRPGLAHFLKKNIHLYETSVISIMVSHLDYKHRCLLEKNVSIALILHSRWQDGAESLEIERTSCLWYKVFKLA